MADDIHQWVACEAHLGLARIFYEWNDLEAAEQHGRESFRLAQQMGSTDRPVACDAFLARLKLAQGDMDGAAAILAEADYLVRQNHFVLLAPEVAAAQVLVLLRRGDLAGAAQLAESYDLPISQARVFLAQGNMSAALAALMAYRQQTEKKSWADERLKAMVLQAVAMNAHGGRDEAMQFLADALALAKPGGFIRLFVDEGLPMKHLLQEAASRGIAPDYTRRLLAAFSSAGAKQLIPLSGAEALSDRELEVLRLIAEGLSNREISERLFLALSTVKGHSRNIFEKLQAQRRTEAVARARDLGLL
jgi:LuxR family maltose regulon positive regulatory protein